MIIKFVEFKAKKNKKRRRHENKNLNYLQYYRLILLLAFINAKY